MNIVTERYRGYYIEPIGNGQYDITELNGDLVDGGFASIEECKHIIDHFDHEGTCRITPDLSGGEAVPLE